MTRLDAALAELAEALRAEIRAQAAHADTPDRLLSVTEAAAAAGIGRSLMYQMLGDGRVRSIRLGRRRVVPSSAIAELAQSPPGTSK